MIYKVLMSSIGRVGVLERSSGFWLFLFTEGFFIVVISLVVFDFLFICEGVILGCLGSAAKSAIKRRQGVLMMRILKGFQFPVQEQLRISETLEAWHIQMKVEVQLSPEGK